MSESTLPKRSAICCALLIAVSSVPASATLRIVNYNIDADTDRNGSDPVNDTADAVDAVYPAPYVAANIVSMANYSLNQRTAPVDVIALQELYSTPSLTLNAIVSDLNATYGPGTYAADTFVGNTGAGLTGNGPNGLIYNTKTVKVLSAVGVASTSGSGAARTPVRYQLQAFTESGNNTFYLYDDHAKAGSASTASGNSNNGTRRAYEYDVVRADADKLGPNAHIIYAGDTNFVSAQNEKGYKDLIAPSGTTLNTNGNPFDTTTPPLVGGVAQAFDPLTTGSFSENSSGNVKYYTEADDDLFGRLDMQLVTSNVLPGSTSPGLQLVPKTYTSFGNSFYSALGTVATVNTLGSTVATMANATALGLTLAQLQSLVNATDHLPLVADYVIAPQATPEPGTLSLLGLVCVSAVRRTRR